MAVLMIITVAPAKANGGGDTADTPLKIGYVSKMLTHPWFIQESQGIEDECDELGI